MRIFTTCCNVIQTAAPQAPENGHPHAPQDGQTQVPQDQWQQWWQQQWWQQQWSLGLQSQVYVTRLAKLVVVVPHPATLPETEAALAPETSLSISRLGGMREAKTIYFLLFISILFLVHMFSSCVSHEALVIWMRPR